MWLAVRRPSGPPAPSTNQDLNLKAIDMLDSINPGSTITVKIVNEPTNDAASKTLARVLAKDPEHVRENKRIADVRRKNYSPSMRGGRLYGGRLVKQSATQGKLGETGTVLASIDVLRDLKSVERFIEVEKA